MIDDLAAWFRRCLDEEERVAQATTPVPVPGRWRAVPDKNADANTQPTLIQGQDPYDPGYAGYAYGVPIIAYSADWQDKAVDNLRHMARHDPARVLRRIKADRRILDSYASAITAEREWRERGAAGVPTADLFVHEQEGTEVIIAARTWRRAVLLLVEPYADQPGFREEWRPWLTA